MAENSTGNKSDSKYDIKTSESKWQDYWEKEKIYHFDPNSDAEPYTIDNPPRYASGGLHIGHAVHYTHIDFVARYKRMRGYNVMFPLCFDVNGMPIEVNVEKKHGIKMRDTPRHEFTKLCEDFANSNIGEMKRQFKILGESMDPSVYYQTDAEYYRRITQITFIKMFKKGLVYKGEFPVNWCPRCGTALAESEVEYKQRQTKLNTIIFKTEDGRDIHIATTRPELLCTCQLVAVHPDDERYADLVGKKLITPIFGRKVPVVADEKVDMDFGTGVVMICTIGDKEDLNWVYKYNLKLEKGIDEHGKMTELAGKYAGMDSADAKQAVIEDLKAAGLLIKQEDLDQNVGTCWRCHTPIELIQVPQWFLKTLDYKNDLLKMADEINWYPEFMKKRLIEWINSLSWDWVISRQRYFATPIPLWQCENCGEVVLAREEDCYVDPTVDSPPVDKCPKCGGNLKGEEMVFDTWMDSSITPLYNTFWGRDDRLFKKLFPMSLRPQSHDIIRTWAYYTMLRSHHLLDSKPWENIMMGGFILAEDGTPMHASKGNAVDPLHILEEYGADPMRYYAGGCAIGEDNPFRWKDVKRGVKFMQKLWSIERFIGMALSDLEAVPERPDKLHTIDQWLLHQYSQLVSESTQMMDIFRFDQVLRQVENFAWHTLADHYIEMVKYRMKEPSAQYTLYTVGLGVIKMLAPFLPHITEEIYQRNYAALEGSKSIHISRWPEFHYENTGAQTRGEVIKDFIAAVRSWKSSEGIPLGHEIKYIGIVAKDADALAGNIDTIKATLRAEDARVEDETDMQEELVGIEPDFGKIGPKYRQEAKEIISAIKSLKVDNSLEDTIDKDGGLKVSTSQGEVLIAPDEIKLKKALKIGTHQVKTIQVSDDVLALVEAY